MTYHFVRPLSPSARMRVSIHVPSGVSAFHDATSSVNAVGVANHSDVHVAESYAMVVPRYGSVYVPVVVPEPARVRLPAESVSPGAGVSVNEWNDGSYDCAAVAGVATATMRASVTTAASGRSMTARVYDGAARLIG